MPNYTYYCDKCNKSFECFSTIREYKEQMQCIKCHTICDRHYINDVATQSASIKKSDSELKTLGDLANRNRDRMSNDERTNLYHKHNDYKDEVSHKELPKGMSRIKKPNKVKWR